MANSNIVVRVVFAATLIMASFMLSRNLHGEVVGPRSTDAASTEVPKFVFVRGNDLWQWSHGIASKICRDASYPSISPDGKHIAFLRANNVWMCDSNGRLQLRLTSFGIHSRATVIGRPSWHPNGNGIAFSIEEKRTLLPSSLELQDVWYSEHPSIRLTSICFVYIPHKTENDPLHPREFRFIGSATSGLESISITSCWSPSFSPNGVKLVFSLNGDLWLAGSESGSFFSKRADLFAKGMQWHERRLSSQAKIVGRLGADPNTRGVQSLQWSSVGNQIVFDVCKLEGTSDGIIKIATIGSNIRIRQIAHGTKPTISRDGRWIAYEADTGDSSKEIWVSSTIRNERRLVVRGGEEPCW